MRLGRSRAVKHTLARAAQASPLVRRVISSAGERSVPSPEEFAAIYLRHYQPHPKQERLDASHARFRAVTAGRRSGKTYWAGRAVAARIVEDYHAWQTGGGTWEAPKRLTADTKPALLYWCVAPTYALGVYQRREFFEAIGGTESKLVLKYVPSRNEVWLVGGILVQFKSADRPLNLVGSGLNGMWLDEAARIKQGTWDENLEPTLQDRQGWAIFTTTPLGKDWYYKQIWLRCLDKSDPDWHGEHFTTADNLALPHLAAEMAKAREKLPEGVFRRNYMADFDAFEGQIFEAFADDATHVVRAVPHRALVATWGGMDFGYRNPGALISLGVDRAGRVYVWAEDYAKGLPVPPPPHQPNADSWARRVERRGLSRVWADPSEPGHIDTLQRLGHQVLPADNSVSAGIDLINLLLKPVISPTHPEPTPALFIHESAVNLRDELLTYRWGDDERPVKEGDHAVDALRYGLYSEYRKGTALEQRAAELREEFPALFGEDMARAA